MDGENSRQRRFVALIGNGKGPVVTFRASAAKVRIRGLVNGGLVRVVVDERAVHQFNSDGLYPIAGGQSAKATADDNEDVLCEIITEK